MEITERFPQPLGNLAQNARFPHFHSRSSCAGNKNTDKNTSPSPCRTTQEVTRLSIGC
jgi:hypothetical protein